MLKFGSEVGYHRDTNHRAAFQASDLIWWGVIRTQSKFQTFAKKLFVRGLSKIRAGTEVNSFSHSSKWRRTSEARPLVHTRVRTRSHGCRLSQPLGVWSKKGRTQPSVTKIHESDASNFGTLVACLTVPNLRT